MFSIIAGTGRIQAATGEPISNLVIHAEIFFVEGETWEPMTKFETGRDGSFKFSIRTDIFANTTTAPLVRLVEQSDETVLDIIPEMKFSRDVLIADFGTYSRFGGGGDTDALERELAAAKEKIAELEEKLGDDGVDAVASVEIKRLKLELIGRDTELKEATTKLSLAESRATAAEEERSTVQLELDQIRNADTASPLITDLAGSVAKSLGDASKSEGAQGFKLADAQVTLKGYLADGGARFKPLDAAEIVRANAAGASEISFRLAPASKTESDGPKMPDLVGLTPASARRVLRPLGLSMQVVEAQGTPVGAVIRQVPKAGAALDPDVTIRLVVAVAQGES